MPIERPRSITSQVNTILMERIRDERYAPGNRLPSESELAAELGVSRASVRSALSHLASQGLVIRKQGDGTYVNAHIEQMPTRMGGLWNFLRLIENSGYRPSIRLIGQETRPANAIEAEALALAGGEPVLALERLFRADEAPVILTHSAAPVSLLRDEAEPIDGELPISDFVRRYYRPEITNHIAYTIFEIEACLPNAATAEVLQLEPGQPLLQLSQVFYDRASRPVFYSLSHLRDKVLKLRLAQAWE